MPASDLQLDMSLLPKPSQRPKAVPRPDLDLDMSLLKRPAPGAASPTASTPQPAARPDLDLDMSLLKRPAPGAASRSKPYQSNVTSTLKPYQPPAWEQAIGHGLSAVGGW